MPEGASRQLLSHDALACSLKAIAVARVVLCCDDATARQCAAATDARLHFPSRSCWIDAAAPDHCTNRTRRPLSLTGVAHALGSAAAVGWRPDRTAVVSGPRVAVSIERGGRRIQKKKTKSDK